jgi:hypothetical protein
MRALLEAVQASIIAGDPASAAPLLRRNPRLGAAEQLAIYSEGYRLRLQGAVRGDYPCLAHYLGAAAMDRLVAAYVEATPSRSCNLDFYASGFGAFVEGLCSDPAARDLAALEQAVAEIFMAPDSDPLRAASVALPDGQALGAMVFRCRAASRLGTFAHDVESFFQDWKKDAAGQAIATGATCLFIVRHGNVVRRHRLEPEESCLLQALADGESLAGAVTRTLRRYPQDGARFAIRMAGWLPRWLREGFFRAC